MGEKEPHTIFTLDDWNPAPEIRVYAPGLTQKEILSFQAFQNWAKSLKESLALQKRTNHTFHQWPYYLRHVEIQACDKFEGRVRFMKMYAKVENDKMTDSGENEWLPGVVFLRGGSVAVLMILRPSDSPSERYVIMTEQARVAAGSLSFMEIPAGMLDGAHNFAGAAAREIEQEVGLKLRAEELQDMTKLAVQDRRGKEALQDAIYPSPGGCDEYITLFLWEKEMERLEIENLKDKLTGHRAEIEKIRIRLLDYESLLRDGARDGKTLAAWSLYEYLTRTKRLK
jgi:ADP-sugar diphosphatase